MAGRRLYALECDRDGCVAVLVAESYAEATSTSTGWYSAGSAQQVKTAYCPDHRGARAHLVRLKDGDTFCVSCGSGPLQPKKRSGVPVNLRHWGKGKCGSCYRERRPVARPTVRRRAADVYEDWMFLKSWGYTKETAAKRLGMNLEAFERALLRHEERQAA